MEFGRRLSNINASGSIPSRSANASGLVARFRAVPLEVKLLLATVVVLVLLFVVSPVHFSTGVRCHSVLKGLKNGAFSHHERVFSLSKCFLEEVPTELLALRELRQLDLANNRISSLPVGFGNSFPELEILFLSSNRFSGALNAQTIAELKALKKLRMVAFRENQLTSIPSNAFPESVDWLILTSNALETIGDLPVGLRKLMLSNNALKSLPSNMQMLQKLELLRVANNRIPTASLHDLPKKISSLKWLAISDNPVQFNFLEDPNVKARLLSKEETVSLPKAISSGQKLGEGSAGVSFKIFFRGELVIYKQFKSDLTSDGRIESEIALAAKNKGEEVLQEVVGITINPIGVMYKLRSNQLEFEAVAGPPSFESCTRDVYKKTWNRKIAVGILRDVGNATSILHSKGVCHGDLYGHNIQVDPNTGRAMLIDMGAAFATSDSSVCVVDFRAFKVLAEENGISEVANQKSLVDAMEWLNSEAKKI